jgi:hopanoid biosynthesis associated RND transporter like protein HpnN
VVTVVVSVILAVAASLYTQKNLAFVTSHLRLLPQDERYVVLLQEYLRDFGELNDIVIAVESPSPERSKRYAARLVGALQEGAAPGLAITYRIDPAYFGQRGLLYLSVDALTRLRDRLFDYQEFIEDYAAHPSLARLLEALSRQMANAMALGFLDLGLGGGRAEDLRFLETTIDQISGRLDGPIAYVSPWTAAFSMGRLDEPDAGYFLSADRRLLFLFVRQERDTRSFGENRERIAAIRRAIARLHPEYPDVQAGVTGGPAISSDEMATAFADSQLAAALAFAATLGLLLAAFRRVVKPMLMLATLAVSLAWSMGIITLVVGHLSIFSVMFISIVVGIGVDYGVYLLYRYEEERRAGGALRDVLGRAAARAGPGMLLGALTAAGAFFVLMATRFRGIAEFGFVSGLAILVAFLSMVTLLPALLALVDGGRAGPVVPRGSPAGPDDQESGWLGRVVRYRTLVLTGAAVMTALAVWGALRVTFSYNMLKLQAHGVESVAWEERILARAGRSGFVALSTAAGPEELRRKHEAFSALPSVSKVESALTLVPDRQAEKTEIIRQFAPLVAPVRVGTAPGLDPAEVRAPLQTLQRRLRLAVEQAGSEQGRRAVQAVRDKVDGLLARLDRADAQRAGPALEELQGQIARDFATSLQGFQKNLDPRPVALGDLPPELRQRYIGASGRFMIRIHPGVDIWERAGAERFVGDLRRVDPDVTGAPITSFEAIRFIRTGYLEGTLYALVLVAAIAAAFLGRVGGTVLALVPLGLGILWTLGVMPALGLEFNLANVWALPLIIGTAAEFGLNIFVRFQEGRRQGGPALGRSTVMAVILNGLTTIAGFASLMVAHHRGIFGLGLLLTIGMVASLLAALIVLPVLLQRVTERAAPGARPEVAGVSSGAAVRS